MVHGAVSPNREARLRMNPSRLPGAGFFALETALRGCYYFSG